ncbi:hypothetical protein HDU97_007532 [Phlyctochytrium planicorne]|nr:hypothetical protein HDU97_007532 [Phlyctochytrium planicorne]
MQSKNNLFKPILKPFQYIQSKMDRIDHAREAYEACAKQFAEENSLMKKYNLKNEFPTWFNSTVLHMWMVNARLRTEGREGKEFKQEMFNVLWLDVEMRLHNAGVKMKLGKIVGDLMSSYYGQTLAYDEGLAHGDAVLASALWRNLYMSKQVSAADLASLVSYTREQILHLDRISNFEEEIGFKRIF